MLMELWEKDYPFSDCSSSPIELVQILEESKEVADGVIKRSKYSRGFFNFIQGLVDIDPAKRATAR